MDFCTVFSNFSFFMYKLLHFCSFYVKIFRKNKINVNTLKLFSIFILLSSSLFSAVDSSGWVSLNRPSSHVEDEVADEDGSWVVFSKEMEKEKFLVRFPSSPEYLYRLEGMEMSSVKGKEKFNLFVRENQDFDVFEERIQAIQAIPGVHFFKVEMAVSNTLDLVYKIEEKWVFERLFVTPHHVYTFQTFSDEFFSENHLFFIDSLYIKSPS